MTKTITEQIGNKVQKTKWYVYTMANSDEGNTRSGPFETLAEIRNHYGINEPLHKDGGGIWKHGRMHIMTGMIAEYQGFTEWEVEA